MQEFYTGNTSTEPQVSVIVPAYDVADYLERTLDSALRQTMPDLEVVVVDDDSKDATFEVACGVAERDRRVRVLRNERNSGPSASRNRAIGAARGRWIALLDGDDVWLPERLERMLAFEGDADVICDDVRVVRYRPSTESAQPTSWSFLQERGVSLESTVRLSLLDFAQHDLGTLKPIIRSAFIRRHGLTYDTQVRGPEDFLFFFEILALGARWTQLPDAYYLWTTHRAGSLTTDRRTLYKVIIPTTRSLLDHPAVAGNEVLTAALEGRIQEAQRILAFDSIRDILLQRRFAEIVRLLLKHPFDLVLAARFVVSAFRLRLQRRS